MKKHGLLLVVILIALGIALLILHRCQSAPADAVPKETADSAARTTAETFEPTGTGEPIETGDTHESEGSGAYESTETNFEEISEPESTEPASTEPQPTEPKPTEPKPTEPTNPPHTHSWSGWKQTKASTCTSAGEETRTCSCGAKETRTVNALGHNWGNWTQTQAPSCGAAGTESRSCSRCSQTETRTVAATGNHSWTETAPTCTEAGAKTCTVFGKKETIAALGHDWVHHDEEGHWIDVLICICGAEFHTHEEWNSHMRSFPREEWGEHSGYSNHGEWIVDVPAYDICSRCGMTK